MKLFTLLRITHYFMDYFVMFYQIFITSQSTENKCTHTHTHIHTYIRSNFTHSKYIRLRGQVFLITGKFSFRLDKCIWNKRNI